MSFMNTDYKLYNDHARELNLKLASLFFTENLDDKSIPSPNTITALDKLSTHCKMLLDNLPNDKGGPVSGWHDAGGRRAKGNLVKNIRELLQYLKLPNGSQKNGPISRILALVHKSATGDEAPWADRYAALAPSIAKRGGWPTNLPRLVHWRKKHPNYLP